MNWRKVLSWEEPQIVSVPLSVYVPDRGYVNKEDGVINGDKIDNILYPRLKNKFFTTIKRILGKDFNLVKAELDGLYDWDESSESLLFEGTVDGPRELIKKLLVTGNSVWPTGTNRQAEEEIADALSEQAIYEK